MPGRIAGQFGVRILVELPGKIPEHFFSKTLNFLGRIRVAIFGRSSIITAG